MKKIFLLAVLVSALLLFTLVSSHQPRMVSGGLTLIENPEVSQAFYGNLNGEPAYYQITSEQGFNLYVGVLVPDLKGIGKDASVEVFHEHAGENENSEVHEEKPVIFLNGLEYNWTYYYEEFAGDSYYKGPEERIYAGSGTYLIKVYSTDNQGKYVLVVGEKEEFPLNEMIRTIFTLPGLKKDFFEKSPLTAYFNVIGVFMLAFLIIILVLAFLAYKISRKFIQKRKR